MSLFVPSSIPELIVLFWFHYGFIFGSPIAFTYRFLRLLLWEAGFFLRLLSVNHVINICLVLWYLLLPSFGPSIKGFINENCFFLSRKGFQIGAFEINVQKKLSSWLLTVILIKYLHSEFLFLLLRKMFIMLLIFRSYCMFGVDFAMTTVLSINTYVTYSGNSLFGFASVWIILTLSLYVFFR